MRSRSARWLISSLMAACLLASAPTAQASPHAETLRYQVSWRGAQVAHLRLQLGCPNDRWRAVALRATSTGLAHDLHSFQIRLDSFLDPQHTVPLQGRTRITEEGRTRAYTSTFHETPTVSVEATIFDEPRPPQKWALPGRGHDLLSWMMHLRWQTEWREGAFERYYVWDGWKLIELRARVGAPSTLMTPKGRYQVWPVHIARTRLHHTGSAPFTPKAEADSLGTLWFTTGAHHTLVGMDFESRVGPANIRLVSDSRTACTE